MNPRKTLLVAALTLSLAGLAIPAAASAYTIKDNGKTLENVNIPMSGQIAFYTGLGYMSCAMHFTLFVNVDHVTVPNVEITETCEGGGAFEGCEVEDDEVTWPTGPVTVNAEDVEVESGPIHLRLSNCVAEELIITPSPNRLKLKLINYKGETKPIYVGFEFGSEESRIEVFGLELEAELEGQLKAVGVEEGTYENV